MLIGIDVGTTAVKAAAFELDGSVVQNFASRYPTHRPAPLHLGSSKTAEYQGYSGVFAAFWL